MLSIDMILLSSTQKIIATHTNDLRPHKSDNTKPLSMDNEIFIFWLN